MKLKNVSNYAKYPNRKLEVMGIRTESNIYLSGVWRNIFLAGFLILILLLSGACVPKPNTINTTSNSSKNVSTHSNSTRPSSRSNTATEDQSPIGEPTSELYWYSNHEIANDTITINSNLNSVIYLRGSDVETFFENVGMDDSYCLVIDYGYEGAKSQLRYRAVGINFNNLSLGRVEKLFRIDVPDKTTNKGFCQGTANSISDENNIVYHASEVCPSCLRTFNSKSIKIFKSTGTAVSEEVEEDLLLVSGLSVRIDPTNASTSNISSCSDSVCSAKGYDCCLEGQCANDGQKRPGALEHPQYFQSKIDIAVNSLNFTKYPEIYYVCTNFEREVVSDNSTTSGECSDSSIDTQDACEDAGETFTTTEEVANNRFEQYKKEYYCLLEAETANPDYAIGSCSDISYSGQTTCENAGETWTSFCYPSGSEEDFKNIRADVWDRCGCEAEPFPTTTEDNPCPDFGLKAVKNTEGEILEVLCKIPVSVIDPPIFQELELEVSTRSAPHRFFIDYDSDSTGNYSGENLDELTLLLSDYQEKVVGVQIEDILEEKLGAPTPSSSNVIMEGMSDKPTIGYTDVANRLSFIGHDDMTFVSLTGEFDVQLTGAKPASVVYVEFGQNYIIRAKEGRYEPCPMCDVDAWFSSFSAHPPSTQGRGLEAIGYTASRDNYVSNITMGNYEDTIFGRACWIPPTMIPMTHRNWGDNSREDRRRRLRAQTALYVNGYQRDWFGFNKGALIGSFDGVKWFAIGGGRRVTAKSTKLFLAINGIFSDLASPSTISVEILTDNGINVASDQDFDPNLEPDDARIESGATCQKYHQCEYDADCVTQLGWEYMCADVSQYRTTVPEFDFYANEENDNEEQERVSIGMSNFLHNAMPSGTKKRCVYRGAGSICKRDYTSLDRFQDDSSIHGPSAPTNRAKIDRQKLITCAPNFYCAEFSDNVFNDKVVRDVSNLGLILYGQDADVLGRPLHYIGGGNSLSANHRNLGENTDKNYYPSIKSYYRSPSGNEDNTINEWGVCRPGKSHGSINNNNSSYLEQHQDKDNLRRADYVSQVGACNPEETSANRVVACPIFDMRAFIDQGAESENGNFLDYIFYANQDDIVSDGLTTYSFDRDGTIRLSQNSCGKEVQFDPGDGIISIFKDIENPSNPSSFLTPGLTEVSCMRRAGAVCHTDLDCSPNKFHAEVAETYSKDAFGGTQAEKDYWEQYLVCGQKDRPPYISGFYFDSYDIRKNRCCREVGKEITMYTYSEDGDTTNYLDTNESNLSPSALTYDDPTATGRYSRYSTNERFNDGANRLIPQISKSDDYVGDYAGDLTNPKPQWQIFQETGRNTCCGNGFVRKFADDTNDWSKRNRLIIPPESYTCLNYRNEFVEAMTDDEVRDRLIHEGDENNDLRTNFDLDNKMFCTSPAEGVSSTYLADDGNDKGYPLDPYHGKGCPQISMSGDDPDDYNDTTPPTTGFFDDTEKRQRDPSNPGDPLDENQASIIIRPYLPLIRYDSDHKQIDSFEAGIYFPHLHADAPFFPLGVEDSGKLAGANYEVSYSEGDDEDNLKGDMSAIWPLPYAVPFAHVVDEEAGTYREKYSSFGASFIIPSYIRSLQDANLDVFVLYRTADGATRNEEVVPRPCADADVNWPWVIDPANGDTAYTKIGNDGLVDADGNPLNDEDFCYAIDELSGQTIGLFYGNSDSTTKCDDNGPDVTKACIDISIALVWEAGNREGSTYYASDDLSCTLTAGTDSHRCEALTPGSPYFYYSKLAKFELLGIPQIDYEPILCNSNRLKLLPGIFEYNEKEVTTVNGAEGSALCDSDLDDHEFVGFCDIDESSLPNSSYTTDTTSGDRLTRVLKDKISMPDIFSENEFLCCVKLGEVTETASNCCSGHAIYVDSSDATTAKQKGMECRLPYGANLNVYFNRYVSSDGLLEDSILREDEEPVGFTLDDFDPRTGEVLPSEDTDLILEALGEKFCTGDRGNNPAYDDSRGHTVRKGSVAGFFPAGPTSFFTYDYKHPDSEPAPNSAGTDTNKLRMGFVDHYFDAETPSTNSDISFPRSYYTYQAGYRWNHHYYCTAPPQ